MEGSATAGADRDGGVGGTDGTAMDLAQRALEAARVGTWEWDMATGHVTWSEQVEPIFGLSPGAFAGNFDAYLALVPEADRGAVARALERATHDGSDAYEIEHRIVWADGSVHWVEGRGRVFRDAAGKPSRMTGIVVDATPRKRAQEALRRTEELFRAIVRDQTEMIVRWLPDGTRTFVNDAYCRAFGGTYEELVGTSFFPLVAEPFRDVIQQKIAALTPETPTATEVHQSVLPDGTLCWQEWTDRGLFDEAGRLVELQSVGRDVSEHVRSREQLRHANRALRTISRCNQALVRATSEDMLLRDVCQAIIEHGDYPIAWVGVAQHDADRTITVAGCAGDDRGLFQRVRASWGDPSGGRGMTGDAVRHGAIRLVRDVDLDPSVAPWRAIAHEVGVRSGLALPLKDTAGNVFAALTVYAAEVDAFDEEDVRLLGELAADLAYGIGTLRTRREHQIAEEALVASGEKLRQLTENVREVMWMVDVDNEQTLFVSPAFETIWGRSCEALYATPTLWRESIHPDDHDRVAEARQRRPEEYDVEYRVVRPDGTIRWVHDRGFPIYDDNHRIYRVAGVAEDITDRKRIEEQFRQAQKMEAIGQLAGGVAHDFNNILAAIMLQVDEAATRPTTTDEVRDFLSEIRQATDRAANLTRQLLQFSRQQVMQPRRLDLNAAVTDLAKMLQRIVREDVRIELHQPATPLYTRCDAGMLDQILMNLAVNARDAMPGGGRLTIETSALQISRDDGPRHDDLRPGPYVSLRVTDDGEGIAAEHLTRIFDPFFTTKSHGTGLGLATVFGIVKQHRGSITATSAAGGGTSFQVLLPADVTQPVPKVVAPPVTTAHAGTETILVVEDDGSLRRLLSRMLVRQGYAVLEASSSVEAIAAWDRHAAAIDLVITDLVMPGGTNGRELAAELQRRAPALKVILTSGYSADIAGRPLELGENQTFLPKPWPPQQLLDVVRRILDA
jgi:two-component system, cell cycle sensor histidine kinase and response regulator CckA